MVRQRLILTKSKVGEIAERSEETTLREPLDDIVHLVTRKEYERWLVGGGGPIARCGYDCSGKEPRFVEATCVVCIDLSGRKP